MPAEYKFYTEFQSHEAEFDFLKSIEIEEKINKICWCLPSNGANFLLSTNGACVRVIVCAYMCVNVVLSARAYACEGAQSCVCVCVCVCVCAHTQICLHARVRLHCLSGLP
jgi:hypothetical protein